MCVHEVTSSSGVICIVKRTGAYDILHLWIQLHGRVLCRGIKHLRNIAESACHLLVHSTVTCRHVRQVWKEGRTLYWFFNAVKQEAVYTFLASKLGYPCLTEQPADNSKLIFRVFRTSHV